MHSLSDSFSRSLTFLLNTYKDKVGRTANIIKCATNVRKIANNSPLGLYSAV